MNRRDLNWHIEASDLTIGPKTKLVFQLQLLVLMASPEKIGHVRVGRSVGFQWLQLSLGAEFSRRINHADENMAAEASRFEIAADREVALVSVKLAEAPDHIPAGQGLRSGWSSAVRGAASSSPARATRSATSR